MGKTKTKIIDDSKPEEAQEKKSSKSGKKSVMDNLAEKSAKTEEGKSKSVQHKDELVERLKAELGIPEEEVKPKAARGDGEEGSRREAAVSETSEDARRETEPAGPRAEAEDKEKPKYKPKVGKEKPRGKKYLKVAELVDPEKHYPIDEAVDLAKAVSYSKFDGTLEIHLNTALKNLRGSISLPFATAKKIRILAFGKGAKESGADIVGDDANLEEIQKGKIGFDVLITTPEWMSKLAPLAKVLGPKGLMPNPKNGTITEDLEKAVSSYQSGKTEYKAEPTGKVIHISLGKVSQPKEELSQNVKVLLSSIGKSKIRKATLSPTMGPGVKLDLSNL